MIILDRPSDSLEVLPVLMDHGQEIGCPEPVFPFFVYRMKHADISVFLHMDGQSVVRIHHSLLFYTGKPVPAKFRDTFQVVNIGIPTVKYDKVWLKPRADAVVTILRKWSFFDISSPYLS